MTKPIHISATQIDMFRQCPRKWAWNYIAKVPRVEKASLALGTRVHEILENYFKNGDAPNPNEEWSFKNDSKIFLPGRIASNMINARTPKPRTAGVEYEFKIYCDKYDFYYVGKLDLQWYENINNILFILDHKTSVDPKAWGKKPEDLDKDIQGILYPWAGLQVYKYSDDIIFTLNYGATNLNNRKNMIVTRTFKPKDIQQRFAEIIEPTAVKMVELKRKGVEPLKIACNPNMCETYGGCDHKQRCNLTDKERIGAFMSGSSLIDDLLAESDGVVDTEESTGVLPDPVNPPEVEQEPAAAAAVTVENKKEEPTAKPKKQARSSNRKKEAPAPTGKIPAGSLDDIADVVADRVIDALVGRVMERLAAKLGG